MEFLLILTLIKVFDPVNCFNSTHDVFLMHDIITSLLQRPETERFLSGFRNSYQRWIITKQLEYCPYTPLCGFSFNLTDIIHSCCENCDCNFPQCLEKNTCCPDIIFQNIDVSFNSSLTADTLKQYTGKNTQKSCIPLHLSSNNVAGMQPSVFGYSTCPSETSKDLKWKCARAYSSDIETLAEIVPVLHKESSDIYRNKYCAYCHNVTDGAFHALESKLLCNSVVHLNSEKSIISEVLNKAVCDIVFISDRQLDGCSSALSQCNITGRWAINNQEIETACALYRSVVTTNNRVQSFQNVFCSECNGNYQPDLECDVQSGDPESGHPTGNTYAFSGLLKLDRQNLPRSHNPSSDTCSEKHIYDKISGTCKEMFCPISMDLINGKCVDIFERLENMFYSVYIRVTPMQTVSLYDSFTASDAIFNYISSKLYSFGQICNMQMMFQSSEVFDETKTQLPGHSSLLFYDIRIQFFVVSYHNPNDIIEQIIKPHNFSLFQNKTVLEFRVRDADPKPFDIISVLSNTRNEAEIGSNDLKNVDLFDDLIENYSFPGYQNHMSFPYLKGFSNIFCSKRMTPLNILRLKLCPVVRLSKDEFPWIQTTYGVVVQPGDYNLNSEDFYFTDENNIMICIENFKELILNVSAERSSSFSVEYILSVVCSSLSIISLAITFTTFSVLSKLRQTIPGKNNMSLVLALLIAQSLYMVSSLGGFKTYSNACLILGILVHFSWLVAMFWMNNCTFHMFRVLTKTKVISHGSGLKRFILYHVYALVMAAICVSINISVSHYLFGDIGYGGEKCYISSQTMVNYTFVIPTAFVVVSNMSMFLFVIFKIRRISSVKINVQHERSYLTVFAKISTITGATWIFGLMYTWTSVTVFSYLFIILNACQGVFIMLAFIINKRVYGLLRTRISGVTSKVNLTTSSSVFTSKT